MKITDYWREPMDEAMARRVLSTEHFDYAVAQGEKFCSTAAVGAWMANSQEKYGAYRTAEREAQRLAKLPRMTVAEYEAHHSSYRSIWSTERTDWSDWAQIRHRYIGKRTLMRHGSLGVEGLSFVIEG